MKCKKKKKKPKEGKREGIEEVGKMKLKWEIRKLEKLFRRDCQGSKHTI